MSNANMKRALSWFLVGAAAVPSVANRTFEHSQMTLAHLGFVVFSFSILLISGCSSKETKVVSLLKLKMESANGALPEFQEVSVDDWDANRLREEEHFKAVLAWKPLIGVPFPVAPEKLKKKVWMRYVFIWSNDDLSVEVKKTDSVTHPYSGTVELSHFEIIYESLEKKGDASKLLVACKLPSNTKKITLQHCAAAAKAGYFLGFEDFAASRQQANGKQRMKLHYRYTDSKWQLASIELCDPANNSWKSSKELEFPNLSQFQ